MKSLGYCIKGDAKNDVMSENTFYNIDCVNHMTTIVHTRKIKDYSIYNEVNTKLIYKAAYLSKKSNVPHFIF